MSDLDPLAVETWYQVTFDAGGLHRAVQPPGREPWADSLAWDAIIRVCLEMEGFMGADTLYLFSRDRPESYAIPTQAAGATALIGELVSRNLLDGKLAIEAASSEGLFCWPPLEEKG